MIVREPGQYLREQLHRFWKWMAAAAGISILICIAGWLLVGRRTPLWSYLVLVLLGASIAYWRDDEIRRWVRNHRQGLKGEVLVGNILETKLGSEYRVLHDRDKTWSNVDHVVVGPTGVFAIETKAWTGKVWLTKRGELRVGGRDEEDAISQATREAMWARGLLTDADIDTYVEALIVLTHTGLPKGPIRRRQVRVVTADDLISEIHRGCRPLTNDQIVRGANAILRAGATVEVRSMMFEG
ncbi:MAG: nuclease-related domain-containing protein [Actinomycetota bacterium]